MRPSAINAKSKKDALRRIEAFGHGKNLPASVQQPMEQQRRERKQDSPIGNICYRSATRLNWIGAGQPGFNPHRCQFAGSNLERDYRF